MPRRARIVIPGMPHHVTQRGNYQQVVFDNDTDFRTYCYLMKKYQEKYVVDILAYCLMNNHVHFIVVPYEFHSLAILFNTVHMCYAQYKNQIKDRKGHLWQGRFYSCVMDQEHLFRAMRYVEQNPVRAKLVKHSWEYLWSSAKQHVGLERNPIIPTTREFCEDIHDWQSYLEQTDNEVVLRLRNNTKKGITVGSDKFITRLERKLGIPLRELKSGRPGKK